jgi:hypothetical protein
MKLVIGSFYDAVSTDKMMFCGMRDGRMIAVGELGKI